LSRLFRRVRGLEGRKAGFQGRYRRERAGVERVCGGQVEGRSSSKVASLIKAMGDEKREGEGMGGKAKGRKEGEVGC